MAQTGIDRRPGMEAPVVVKPIRTCRFAHLAASKPAGPSLLTSSPMALAALVALAVLGGCDHYFFDGYYGRELWQLVQHIGGAFRF
jgi:hypothetical protein